MGGTIVLDLQSSSCVHCQLFHTHSNGSAAQPFSTGDHNQPARDNASGSQPWYMPPPAKLGQLPCAPRAFPAQHFPDYMWNLSLSLSIPACFFHLLSHLCNLLNSLNTPSRQDEQVDKTTKAIDAAIKLSYCSLTQWTNLQNKVFYSKVLTLIVPQALFLAALLSLTPNVALNFLSALHRHPFQYASKKAGRAPFH